VVAAVLGAERAAEVAELVAEPEGLEGLGGLDGPAADGDGDGDDDGDGDTVARATIAMAVAMVLFHDLCERVLSARAYAHERRAEGARVFLDHGAVRTIDWLCGQVPPGQEQVARLLRPLGYEHRETYDLASLKMTGHSWAHADAPEAVPQWFVSELHPDRLSAEVQSALTHLLAPTVDPLTDDDRRRLAALEADHRLPFADAVAVVRSVTNCFRRLHPEPTDRDYDLFARESAELAWIATEGTTCNHWTDRVADVTAAAEAEREAGRPIKDTIEVSGSGRVRQTAHRAALVDRHFHTVEGDRLVRTVPGSFFELIERRPLPDGSGLDLAFDAANATGIFAMTRAEPEP
jgi:hypothetical protein